MKKFKSIHFGFIALATLGLVFTSCKKDEDELPPANPHSEEITEVKNATAIDNELNVIEDFIVESYNYVPKTLANSSVLQTSLKSKVVDCRTITSGGNNTYDSGYVTIDFSNSCEIRGRKYSGKINIRYTYEAPLGNFILQYDLENYYCNGTQFEGAGTVIIDFSNELQHRVHTHQFEIWFTLPNEVKATRKGELTREWVVLDINTPSNSVAEITGNWKDTYETKDRFLNDFLLIERNYVIHSDMPLRYELSCGYFVSGAVNISHENFLTKAKYDGVLNFGNGVCDRTSTLTLTDNTVITIQD